MEPGLERRRGLFRDGLLFRVVLTATFSLVAIFFGSVGLVPWGSAAVSALILAGLGVVNLPYWLVARACGFPLSQFKFHWAVDIVALTVLIHFVGGIDTPYAALAYSALVLFAAVSESRRTALLLATLSMVSFGALILLEATGLVSHVEGLWGHHFSLKAQVLSLVMSFIFTFALGFVGGTLADRLKESNAELRSVSVALEEHNRELERRVAERTAELAAATQEIADLVHIMSHDLKNVAVGATETARQLAQQEESRLSETGRRYTRHLLEDSRALSRMLEDLLRLFRATDPEAAEREWVDVSEVVRGVARRLQPRVERANVDLVIEPMPPVFAEPAKIRHIFDNLIDNACKYVGETGAPRVEVGGQSKSGEVEYFVRDNGMGISERHQERVFQLYHRVPSESPRDGAPDGHGVGLAIVKRIVERYGGRIELESQLGRGSTFRVYLPGGEGAA